MMEVFLEVLYRFGLPTALLLLQIWERFHTVKKKDSQTAAMSIAHAKALKEKDVEHARQIAAKDEEIKRLNEARHADQAASTERSIRVATEFTELTAESNKTSALMVDKLGGLTAAVDRLERARHP